MFSANKSHEKRGKIERRYGDIAHDMAIYETWMNHGLRSTSGQRGDPCTDTLFFSPHVLSPVLRLHWISPIARSIPQNPPMAVNGQYLATVVKVRRQIIRNSIHGHWWSKNTKQKRSRRYLKHQKLWRKINLLS